MSARPEPTQMKFKGYDLEKKLTKRRQTVQVHRLGEPEAFGEDFVRPTSKTVKNRRRGSKFDQMMQNLVEKNIGDLSESDEEDIADLVSIIH